MYREFKGLNLPEIDKEIREFWLENGIFRKSIAQRDKENNFVFYEGPPSANGKPGIHHVLSRTIKDLFCRYQTMKGQRVERKGGWDTHGLPVELKVESELGITKEDIGKTITVEEYNRQCRETVMRYKDLWDDITRKMGYWVDLKDPYITFENKYIESVWYLLKLFYDKGLIYKGYTIQPYSPAAGTGLSSHELNMPGAYKDVKDTSVVAQFKVARSDKSVFLFDGVDEGDVFFLAWTTTPWTLPSNTALAVGKKITYVRVATYNPYTNLRVNLILAKDLLSYWFNAENADLDFDAFQPSDKKIPYKVTGEFKGADLEFIPYEQLMPYQQPDDGEAFKVLVGNFVSTEDGTGIVHIAPSFGADDMRIAKQYGFGSLTLVDNQGKFVDSVTDYAGRYVKDYKNEGDSYENVDIDIVVQLKKENKAFNVQKYNHNYPHCWRTDKPVLYYPLDSWFIKSTALKDRMAELNKTINWKPAHTGEKRFGNWLENLQDWNLSRSRFWGVPLPIWRTEDGEQEKCIGSTQELSEEIEKAVEKGFMKNNPYKGDIESFDLHRPYIDDVVLCSEDGRPMHREKDLIDVWFDSGAMPYAQWHYPFENEEKFRESFPAEFISEGVDQTRGWFFTLHAIATMASDSVAFKNVVSHGLVLDKDGVKMSKRLGNVLDPFETIETYGADPTRWYMITNAPPWENIKFDIKGVQEVQRKFFGTLYNTYNFFALYANIGKFSYDQDPIPVKDRKEIDRWIISSLNTLVQNVEREYAGYEPTNAGRLIQNFVDGHLSNWYVRLCRRRFWKEEVAAFQTLYECLLTVAKLMAPIGPFFADWLYRNLNTVSEQEPHESVHLAFFPEAIPENVDRGLEERMDYAQRISSLVLSLRKKSKMRVRQPLKRVLLPILNKDFQRQVDLIKHLVMAEVNVKNLEYLTDASGIIKKKIKPNFKTLGKRLGKNMKTAAQAINGLSQDEIGEIEKSNRYELNIDGEVFVLNLEDFVISSEDIPGWEVASDGKLTVALDITMTDSLLAEGTARELVNRIQNIRKNKDFDVTDKIKVTLENHEAISSAVEHFGDYICTETLATKLALSDQVKGEVIELPDEVNLTILVELNK